MNSKEWAHWVEENPNRVACDSATGDPTPVSSKMESTLESVVQKDVIRWARSNATTYPELALLHSIPNEGFADLTGASAAERKKMGILRGLPDLHLPAPSGDWPSLWLELKAQENDLTEWQHQRLRQLARFGHAVDVAWTAEGAIFSIKNYLDDPDSFLSGY